MPDAALASFPGQNGRIVFTQDNGGTGKAASWRVMSMVPDGTGLSVLASGGAGSVAVSADGSRIAFAGTRKKNAGIWTMRVDGTHARRLTTNTGRDFAWSPNGATIAFVRGAEIRTIGARGGAEQVVAGGGAGAPSWAPDGSRIAFLRGSDIFTVQPGGGGEQMAVAGAGAPDWAPDGSRFAFSRAPSGIFSTLLDGSGELNLTGTLGGTSVQPDWAPDGQRIAFAHTEGGVAGVWTMAADGSQAALGAKVDHMVDFDWAPDTPRAPLKTSIGTVPAQQSLGAVLRRGLRVPYGCATRCNVTGDLLASRSALHSAKVAVLAHGGVHLKAVGGGPLVVRVRPSARRALKRVHRLVATLRMRVATDEGSVTAASQQITIVR